MTNTGDKLRALASWLDSQGLGGAPMHVSVELRRVWLSVWAYEVRPEALRRIKRVFGPLKASGNPPTAYLSGQVEDEGLGPIDLALFSAYECELEGYDEVREGSEELKKQERKLREQLEKLQQSGGVRQVPRYRCVPVRGLEEGEA